MAREKVAMKWKEEESAESPPQHFGRSIEDVQLELQRLIRWGKRRK